MPAAAPDHEQVLTASNLPPAVVCARDCDSFCPDVAVAERIDGVRVMQGIVFDMQGLKSVPKAGERADDCVDDHVSAPDGPLEGSLEYNFVWGDVDGETFAHAIHAAYE